MTDLGKLVILPEFGTAGELTVPRLTSATAVAQDQVRVSFDQGMKRTNPLDPEDVTNPANYAFGVGSGGVAVAPVSVAVVQQEPTIVTITLDREMTSGKIYTVTASNVKSTLGMVIDPTENFKTFTGLGYKPQVSSATAIDGVIIWVDFNEEMKSNAALVLPANYVFTSPTGPDVNAILVEIISGTRVRIWLDLPCGIGDTYTVTVSNVEDVSGNPIDGPPFNQATFDGIDVTTKLEEAEVINEHKIRAHFSKPMIRDDLLEMANWTLVAIGSGAAPLYLGSISLPAGTYPEYADLNTSEMTNAKDYQLEVSTTVRDRWGNTVSPFFNTRPFVGLGVSPTVEQVVATGINRVKILFSESMLDNVDIQNASKYAFDKGLLVLSVLSVNGNEVELVTSDQTPGELYSLAVTP